MCLATFNRPPNHTIVFHALCHMPGSFYFIFASYFIHIFSRSYFLASLNWVQQLLSFWFVFHPTARIILWFTYVILKINSLSLTPSFIIYLFCSCLFLSLSRSLIYAARRKTNFLWLRDDEPSSKCECDLLLVYHMSTSVGFQQPPNGSGKL